MIYGRFPIWFVSALVLGAGCLSSTKDSGDSGSNDTAQPGSDTDSGGSVIETYECTNPDPLTCPENDCYEMAVGSDNDRASTATPLGIDGDVEAILCAADGGTEYDNFKVSAAPGCAMSAIATFTYGKDSPAGDLYVYIERNNSSVIQDTNSDLDGVSRIDIISRSPEPYNVYMINGNSSDAVYNLSFEADCASLVCPDNDRNEPNGTVNDASGGEAPITLLGDVYGAIACTGDSDWYYHPASTAGAACRPKAIVRFDESLDSPLTVDIRISDVTDIDEEATTSTPGVLVVTADGNVPGSAVVGVQPTGADEPVYTVELLCE